MNMEWLARWGYNLLQLHLTDDEGCALVFPSRPELASRHAFRAGEMCELDSDVLMVDWHYTTPFWESSLELFARSPFEFRGAPATICWMSCISPNPVNIGNLREFSGRGLRFRSRGLSGMLNTVWCPWRNLTGAIDLALGLGGHLFSNEAESSDYPRRFAQDFYGLARRDAGLCGDAIMQLYMHAPDRFHHERVMAGSDGANRFSREDARPGGIHHARMTRIAETLARLAGRARRNAERLGDVVLTARALAAVGGYAAEGRRKGRVRGRAGLVKAVEKAWDRDRYLDDPQLRRFKRTPEHYLRAWMIHGLRSL